MPGPLGLALNNPVMALGGGVSILPLDIDFSTLEDGALPEPLVGATWAVSSGVAVNTPTLGSELLTDPGLEAAYTDGKCNSLSKTGLPTLTESADSHGGSKAQQYIGALSTNNISYENVTGVVGNWYQFSSWGKRTAGAANNTYAWLVQANALPAAPANRSAITSATYAQLRLAHVSTETSSIICSPARGGDGSDTVIVDDGSLKIITPTSLHALINAGRAAVTLRAQLNTLTDETLIGLVIRADTVSNPTNALYVYAYQQPTAPGKLLVGVLKRLNATYTALLATVQVDVVADAYLEARTSGTTVQVFYNGTQVGTDLTEADCATYTHFGIFSSGNNGVKRFLVAAG